MPIPEKALLVGRSSSGLKIYVTWADLPEPVTLFAFMNSWTPLWSQVVDSSLWEEKPSVRVLFMTMLALKDADHIVRYDAYKLHKKAHLTAAETLEALEVLKSPDTGRQQFEQEFDGRRIEEVAEGWLVLNGAKYREMIQKMRIRQYKTDWQRDARAAEKRAKEVVLTGKDAERFEQSRVQSWQKRRKVAEEAGVKAGAQEALKAGLAEANGEVPRGTSSPKASGGAALPAQGDPGEVKFIRP